MSKPLVEEIKDFQKSKKKLIPIVFVLGIFGLFLPILPGMALLLLVFLLLFPSDGDDFIKKTRNKLSEYF